MSLGIKDTKATVWKMENKEKYSQSNLSTSRKDKDGKWINMFWRARFVGDAHQNAFNLPDKTRIVITNGIIEQTKVEDKIYYNIIIFNFKNLDIPNEANVEVEISDSELPF